MTREELNRRKRICLDFLAVADDATERANLYTNWWGVCAAVVDAILAELEKEESDDNA